ncbi:MAG TPA: Ger(x)C family spore germination protein [Caproicibacter sp.]|nr:Ger(x)C family spore germination protein [Caproicibacter sp.]
MKRWKKIFLLFETICIVFLFTGCFNYREIERNTIVAGMAIDKGTGGYKYHMTFETLSLGGGKDQSAKSVLLASDGNTIFDCVRNSVTMADKKLYFSDSKVIIISKELAQEGIKPLLDFFLRDAEPRITMNMLVSDEDTAADILKVKVQTNEPVSYKISGMLEQTEKSQGHVLPTPLFQSYNILSSGSQDLTLPNVRVVKLGESSEPQVTTNIIFKGDKMAGYMPDDECLYYLILKNKIASGILLTGFKGLERDISLEIQKCSAKIEPTVDGNNVTMKIQIQMDASLGEEQNSNQKYTVGNGEFESIEKVADETIKEGTENLISDVQKNFGTDIFGFGTAINKNKYGEWEKISKDWGKIFPNVKCEVTADVKVLNSATAFPKGGEK